LSQRGRPPLPHNVFAFDETHLALYFSRLLDLELAETAYRIALTERFGTKRHRAMRTDGRALRRAFRLTTQLQESWLAVLAASRWARVEVEVVMPDVPLLMARGLGSYDAVHAATAIAVGVNALVTLDKGFGLVREEDLVIVTDATYLRGCRQHRKRQI